MSKVTISQDEIKNILFSAIRSMYDFEIPTDVLEMIFHHSYNLNDGYVENFEHFQDEVEMCITISYKMNGIIPCEEE